jgi:hypothetical protein
MAASAEERAEVDNADVLKRDEELEVVEDERSFPGDVGMGICSGIFIPEAILGRRSTDSCMKRKAKGKVYIGCRSTDSPLSKSTVRITIDISFYSCSSRFLSLLLLTWTKSARVSFQVIQKKGCEKIGIGK